MFGSGKKRQSSWLSTFRKRELTPLAVLAQNISRVAFAGAEQLKPHIQSLDEQKRMERWFLLVCEFLYFFMHMANRSAFKELGHAKRCKFQDELYPLLVRPNIEAICGSWPTDLKDRLERDFTEKLGDAEIEYGACKKMLDNDNPLTQDALFSKFACNICELVEAKVSDSASYTSTFMKAIDISLESYNELNLSEAVVIIGKEL
jgi:hypothetical protein